MGQFAGITAAEIGTLPFGVHCSFMDNRRDEIDEEVRHLRKLANQLTDQKTLEGIRLLIADLEVEKTALDKE
jgi:hypothetical protein